MIPDGIERTYTNDEHFLWDDSGREDPDRILIFATQRNIDILNEIHDWYCDGTFSISPSLFRQVFTIHVIRNGHNLPLVYCLLPDKKEETYKKAFGMIIEFIFCSAWINHNRLWTIRIKCVASLISIVRSVWLLFPFVSKHMETYAIQSVDQNHLKWRLAGFSFVVYFSVCPGRGCRASLQINQNYGTNGHQRCIGIFWRILYWQSC